MNAIVVDDEHVTPFLTNLKGYPAFDNVYKFHEDVSIVKNYLMEQSLEIDVAFLDHFIGDFRGTELGGWINKNFPHIACILITGGNPNDAEDKEEPLLQVCQESLEKGFCAFLLKGVVGTDKDVLFSNLNRIMELPSFKAKQQNKQDKVKGETLEARLKAKYKVYDFYATEMCLHSVELIGRLFQEANSHNDCTTLHYSRCFTKVEQELKFIKLKGHNFELRRFGNSNGKKGYSDQMKQIRDYFDRYDFADAELRTKILNGYGKNGDNLKVNRLHKFFSEEKNRELTYLLLEENPEKWKLTREHFTPVKNIIKEFNMPNG